MCRSFARTAMSLRTLRKVVDLASAVAVTYARLAGVDAWVVDVGGAGTNNAIGRVGTTRTSQWKRLDHARVGVVADTAYAHAIRGSVRHESLGFVC